MRFLVSIILSCLFFIAPFQGNAGGVPNKQSISGIDSKSTGTTYSDYAGIDDYAKVLAKLDHRNSSISRYRTSPFKDTASTVVFISGIKLIQNRKFFVQPYSYCKRFGLKLIFPEHYFW